MMQATFSAHFNHDDPKETIVIIDAYPKGTPAQTGLINKFTVPANEIVQREVVAIVSPVRAKKGMPWVGRFVLVDQFQRRYRTKKMTFRWIAPPPPSPSVQNPAEGSSRAFG